MKRIALFALAILSLAARPVAAQAPPLWGDLRPGTHAVGFRVVAVADSTRAAPGGTGARALRVSLWYPARPGTGPAMRLRDYAHAIEAEPGRPLSPAAAERRSLAVRDAPGFPESRLGEVMALAASARQGAAYAPGRFPLVVLGAGWGYESPLYQVVLAEYLASHGYVVAAAPLVGTRIPLAHVSAADLETQVRDLEVVIARARRLPPVDGERLGVAGFDLGGVAGALLAMSRDDVRGYVSIDSGILSGRILQTLVRPSPRFDPRRLRAAVLAVTRPSAELAARRLDEELSLLDSATYAREVRLLRVPRMRHADFTLFGPLEGVAPRLWGAPPGEPARYSPVVARHVLAFLDAHVRGDAAALAALGRNEPPASLPGVTVELRPGGAHAGSGSADALVSEALAGDVAGAIRRHGGTRSAPLDEALLRGVGAELLHRRGDAAGAARWLEFGATVAPASAGVRTLLGDAHLALGARPAAAEAYRAALRADPDNAEAREKLRKLEP